ncbi:unnamed protein product [Closterium sp. Naga37s-1]|nr:unnamed protein product [Closterium sp. Naga37s-1]
MGLVPPPPDHGEEEAWKKEVIKAVLRPGSGKIQAKKERRLGRIPSIVFEQEDGHLGGRKRLVSVDRKQIGRLVKKFGRPFFVSQVFDLEIAAEGAEAAEGEAEGLTVEGARMRVIPKLVHWHGGTDEILNVTFLKLPERESARVKVPVPLVFVGEDACPGIKKGGWLYTMRRTLPFSCPPSAIPPFVEVDLSALDVGHKITLADVARQNEQPLLAQQDLVEKADECKPDDGGDVNPPNGLDDGSGDAENGLRGCICDDERELRHWELEEGEVEKEGRGGKGVKAQVMRRMGSVGAYAMMKGNSDTGSWRGEWGEWGEREKGGEMGKPLMGSVGA